MDQQRNEHFARVTPIVGTHLREVRVAVIGLARAMPIINYLAACGVRCWHWLIEDDASVSVATQLCTALLARHGAALALDVRTTFAAEWQSHNAAAPPDLVLGVGNAHTLRQALAAAQQVHAPALLVTLPDAAQPCQAICLFPGEYDECEIQDRQSAEIGTWAWNTSASLCASLARALLLRDTPYRRDDLAALWAQGQRRFTCGTLADPFTPRIQPFTDLAPAYSCTSAQSPFATPPMRRGTLLIAGLGSLGSVATMHLAAHTQRLVIADPDRIDGYNPVRQAYSLASVGMPKATALHDELIAAGMNNVVALQTALTSERQVDHLVATQNITAALVVTGTDADFAIARALRAHGVPHIVGRCYPRARYWEAIIVDGARGPAFADLRGRLGVGPAPAPTPEQRAAYSDLGLLEAEPATLIESGWAAAWLARLTSQLLVPAGLRERWFLELLGAEHICVIGGIQVETTENGPAYGIETPGAVRAWSRAALQKIA